MEVQQEIAFEFGDSLVGYELDVLIDGQVDDETWVGRSYADAPEIDGSVYVQGTGPAPRRVSCRSKSKPARTTIWSDRPSPSRSLNLKS